MFQDPDPAAAAAAAAAAEVVAAAAAPIAMADAAVATAVASAAAAAPGRPCKHLKVFQSGWLRIMCLNMALPSSVRTGSGQETGTKLGISIRTMQIN